MKIQKHWPPKEHTHTGGVSTHASRLFWRTEQLFTTVHEASGFSRLERRKFYFHMNGTAYIPSENGIF